MEEITVEVTDETEPETPEVIDTGDTIIITDAGGTDDAEIDRWVAAEQRYNELASRYDELEGRFSELAMRQIDTEIAIEEEQEPVVEEESTDGSALEDEIVPSRTHPWFRPMREFFH